MGKCNFRVAVNLVFLKDNKVCLLRRYNTGWNDGMYALMGGHVEDGENPIDAAKREAMEEFGVVVNNEDLNHLLTCSVYPDHVYLYFGCSNWQGEIKNMEPDQCDDVRFFDIDELPKNMLEVDRQSLNYIFKTEEKDSLYQTFGYQK
jgi:ADP-ribose pyrophosphatase YjhB (NUDIX family)